MVNKLALSIGLGWAPVMAIAYYYAAQLLLSRTAAGRYIEEGGSIVRFKLDIYHAVLIGAAILGMVTAFLLGSELAKVAKRKDS